MAQVIKAFHQRTGSSWKAEDLFLHGGDVSLDKSGNGFVRVWFSACVPNSKLCSLVRYFASFDQEIWLGTKCRVQAAVSPFYADLVKFAQLGYGIEGCKVTGYRVLFESCIPQIQVGGARTGLS